MILTKIFNEFFNSEKTGGLILVLVTVVSLILANSAVGANYISLWEYEISNHHLVHWINDGLMTLFFLLIGLEIEREVYKGELSGVRNAMLPVFGALGGMVVPAAIHILFNYGKPTIAGAGIPMATDIAFAIGILSLLGRRVPGSLKVFLTALAVIDDLGAIIIIAVFYTKSIVWTNLLLALGIFLLLIMFNRLKIRSLIPYLAGGFLMWYLMESSGVHATISGILLAFAIPFGSGDERSPSYLLQHWLHKPVAFVVLPLFAAANTSIIIGEGWFNGLADSNNLGIMAGLVIGKPLGILLFSFAGAALGLCALPSDLKWKNIFSAGMIAGIGFTMSIFITLLAYDQEPLITGSKIAILIASTLAGAFGYFMLRVTLRT